MSRVENCLDLIMRKLLHLIVALAVLLLLTGCTSFQAKEARRAIAVGFVDMAIDAATEGLDRHREGPQGDSAVLREAAEREEEARRKRERETRHYEEEAAAIMDSIEQAELRTGELQPEPAVTDFELEAMERLQHREKVLEHQTEFDEFMQELETAEEKNNDPRLSRISGE